MKDSLFTGLGLKVQGHLKIYEYASRSDYSVNRPARKLLDRRNAIHKDNASILVIKAITNQTDSNIRYMVFGNGGTSVDDTGTITFNPTNDADVNADLYNPVFFQMVDDRLGSLPGNQMAVRHMGNTLFSDVDIRALIYVNEPFGQQPSNTIKNITTPTTFGPFYSQFTFDEIGLKSADGTLITHVIFTPILKTASSLLEVVYTLRVAIDLPIIDRVSDLFGFDGVESIIEIGEPTIDIPVPVTYPLVGVEATTEIGPLLTTSIDSGPFSLPAVLFSVDPPPPPPPMHRAIWKAPVSLIQSDGPLTGVGSTPTGIFSVWYRQITTYPGPGSGLSQNDYNTFNTLSRLWNLGTNQFPIASINGATLNFLFNPINNDGSAVTDLFSNFNTTTINEDSGQWHHIIWAWDLSSGDPYTMVQVYIDGVSYRDQASDLIGNVPFTTIDYSTEPVNFLSIPPAYASLTDGLIAELYFAPGQYLDLSNPTNLAKFYNGGFAVELGIDGSTPTGTSPAVYLSGPLEDVPGYAAWTENFFLENRGTGGTINIIYANPDNPAGHCLPVDRWENLQIWDGGVSVFGPSNFTTPRDPFPG